MRIGLRVPEDVAIALENYLSSTGQEKTEYIVNLIRENLSLAKVETLVEKVESLDIRVINLESKLNRKR
jgi:hypothetical protein